MFYKPYPKSIELVEKLRVELYTRWLEALEGHYEGYLQDNFELPDDNTGRPCVVGWMENVDYPVLSIEYMGMLPHYDEDMRIKGKVRDIYQRAFHLADSGISLKHRFEQAHIFVLHYFPNKIIRDLDNRYTKFVIDNLRHGGYIPDDNWQHVSWTEMGLFGKEARVVMLVIDVENTVDFYRDYIQKLKEESEREKERIQRMFGGLPDGESEEEPELELGPPLKNRIYGRRKNNKMNDTLF